MKIVELGDAWASRRAGCASNLSSDGRSAWSYGWYEIARHVGTQLAFIRHPDEDYSRATRKHVSALRKAAIFDGVCLIAVKGADEGGIHAARMGQPDWSWISLCLWFDAREARVRRAPWPGSDFLVSIRPGVEIDGRGSASAALRFAQRVRDIVPLARLCTMRPGYGEIVLQHGAAGQQLFRRVEVPLDHLDPVWPDTPPSYRLAADVTEGMSWWRRLFADAQVPDIRTKPFVYVEAATEFGEPPEPIIPAWPRLLTKAG